MFTVDDVVEVVDTSGGDLIALFVKGHHDLASARTAFVAYALDNGWEPEQIEGIEPTHETWRKVPIDGYAADSKFIRDASGPGAFPVTHFQIETWK